MDDLRTFTFGRGSHKTRADGLCVMEAVAMLSGEEHFDHPICASWVITELAIWVNDSCGDELRNELLRDLPWRIVGTDASAKIEKQRVYMVADWAVRFVTPLIFDRVGLADWAAKLRELSVIDCERAARAAYMAARGAADYAAGRELATSSFLPPDLASCVAKQAAGSAKRAVVQSNDAVRCAIYCATNAANSLNLNERETIQRSCVALIDRMIRLTEPQEVVPTAAPQLACSL